MMQKRTRRATPGRAGAHRLDPDVRRLFAYLDGELAPTERAAFEAALVSDPRFAGEVRVFRTLLAALGRLAAFSPSADFKVRVLAALGARRPAWMRAWQWIAGTGHPAVRNVFGELLEDGLPPRQARALAAFVARDREAATALASWRRLHGRLDRLPVLAPGDGFEERVMARIGTAPAPVRARTAAARRLLLLWPERGQRLAAALGMAFAPTALAASFAYVLAGIFRNPLVTPERAAAFLWDKGASAVSALSDALLGGWAPGTATAMGPGGVPGAFLLALFAGLIVLGGMSLVSGRILYRIFVNQTGMDRRHVPG